MSGQTTLRWIPGGNRFVSTDSTGHSVVMSTPNENSGMKPSELVLSALAGCASVDVVDILAKKRTPLSHLEVQVSAEQDADPPWTFRKIYVKFLLKGEGLTEKNVETGHPALGRKILLCRRHPARQGRYHHQL